MKKVSIVVLNYERKEALKKLKNAGVSSWLVMLALSAITLLAGVFIVFNQSSIIVATGIVMITWSLVTVIKLKMNRMV